MHYVDLYQIHRLDYETPIEADTSQMPLTLRGLHYRLASDPWERVERVALTDGR
jgi:aryl-alcohol dehydrogenase-like predicted oxidoreductase